METHLLMPLGDMWISGVIWRLLERMSPRFKLGADLFHPHCWDFSTSAVQTLLEIMAWELQGPWYN